MLCVVYWKSDLGMTSQWTLEPSTCGKHNSDLHERNFHARFGQTWSLNNGQRGNAKHKNAAYFYLSTYFFICKRLKDEGSVHCLHSEQPSLKANSGVVRNPQFFK